MSTEDEKQQVQLSCGSPPRAARPCLDYGFTDSKLQWTADTLTENYSETK